MTNLINLINLMNHCYKAVTDRERVNRLKCIILPCKIILSIQQKVVEKN